MHYQPTTDNQSSIFGVDVSGMSTSNGGMSAQQQLQYPMRQSPCPNQFIYDSAFNQVMQLLVGFCRNSNCTLETVRMTESPHNFETMTGAFTAICPSTLG